jgi:hypothetical protein
MNVRGKYFLEKRGAKTVAFLMVKNQRREVKPLCVRGMENCMNQMDNAIARVFPA